MSLGNVHLNPISEAQVERLQSDDSVTPRYRVTRQWDVNRDLAWPGKIESEVFDLYGTEDGTYNGSNAQAIIQGRENKFYPGTYLISQKLTPARDPQANQILTKIYETVVLGEKLWISSDELASDENDRKTLKRQYIAFSSEAENLAATAGTILGTDLVCTGYQITNPGPVIATITETYIQATNTLTQIGQTVTINNAEKGGYARLADGGIRKKEARFIILTAASYTPGVLGTTAAPDDANFVMEDEKDTPNNAVRIIERAYVEVTTTVVEIGNPDYSRDDNGRLTIKRVFVVRPTTAEPPSITSAVGTETFGGCVCADAIATQTAAICRISKTYIQATTIPTLIGNWSVHVADHHAFKITPGPTYKPVREFVGQYLVQGDGSLASYWLGLNTSLTIGGATAYLTEEDVTHKGLSYAIITRIYTELPDTFTFPRQIDFNDPGVLGVKPPTTGKIIATITEAYSLGAPTPTTLGYNLKRYATQTIVAKVTGDSASTTTQEFKSGYLSGGYSLSASNSTINGIKYDSYLLTSDSDPVDRPAGAQVISSQPEPWRGQIWKLTNETITF